MTYIDSVIYKGQKNTPEGIKKAFEAGWISEETKNELLRKYQPELLEVA